MGWGGGEGVGAGWKEGGERTHWHQIQWKKKLITRLLESGIKRFLEKSPKICQMTMELVQILKIFLG